MTSAESAERTEAAAGFWNLFLLVCLPFGFGYFFVFLLRSINAVISGRLVAELDLDPATLGVMTGILFAANALFQIPLGMLLDRYGPRRVQTSLFMIAALGALAFAFAPDALGLTFARALMGIGLAGGLMCSLKIVHITFPRERWPLAAGMVTAVGGLGAIAATEPVEWILGLMDWRDLFLFLAAGVALMGLAIFLIVPEPRGRHGLHSDGLWAQCVGVGRIFASAILWRIAPAVVLMQAVGLTFQTLWTAPWMRAVDSLGQQDIASLLVFIGCGPALGFFVGGWLGQFCARRGVPQAWALLGSGVVNVAAQAVAALGLAPGEAWPWVLLVLSSSSGALAFTTLAGAFPLQLSGRVNTALNLLVFTVTFAMQWGFGLLVQVLAADGDTAGAYRSALGLILVAEFAAWGWFVLSLRRGRLH